MAENSGRNDLEDRTLLFAQNVRRFIKRLPSTISNIEDIKQIARSSGSVAANYIEANEALSKKDFLMKIKICRREAKESRLQLRLLDSGEQREIEKEKADLMQEVKELTLTFSSIVSKASG